MRPWPVPPGTDFQSRVTLELLHHSFEAYGEIPVNKEFRSSGTKHGYHNAIP